jgi:Galactose oxidase, central domain
MQEHLRPEAGSGLYKAVIVPTTEELSMKHEWRMFLVLLASVMFLSRAEAQVNWIQPSSSPGTRCCAGMVYEISKNDVLLFGGYGGPANPALGDTWVLGDGGWFQLNPATSPPARAAAAMAYDATTKTVVLFGGLVLGGVNSGEHLNDTWIWDGTTWTQVNIGGNAPSPRRFEGMAYEPATGTVLLFGGIDQSNATFGDTWRWNGITKTWTRLNPKHNPPPRRAPLAHDGATGTIVLFGGESGFCPTCTNITYGDTWVWNGTDWHQRLPVTSPPPRSLASLAYDRTLGRLVLFGGAQASSGSPYYNDTWTWDGTNWTQLSLVVAPPARYAFGMAYDPRERALVIFGGLVDFDNTVLTDTWILGTAP